MPSPADKRAIARNLTELHTSRIRRAGSDEILAVVNQIIEAMNRDIPTIEIVVRDDLEDLASYIRTTKAEIMELKPVEIAEEHLPAAAVELDAIVSATERATHSIMGAAERIETVAEEIGGNAALALSQATTQIYEACGFQDITGQRVGKIIKALQDIESKVDGIIAAFGEETAEQREARRRYHEQERERLRQEAVASGNLQEGPQLPEDATSQDDIDALFNSS